MTRMTAFFAALHGFAAFSSAATALPATGFRGASGPEPSLENIGGPFSAIDPEQGVLVAPTPEGSPTGLQPIPLPGPGLLGVTGLAAVAAIRRRRTR